MWWIIAAVFIAAFVLSYVLYPKIKTTAPKASRDISAPTAEVGREIGVLFGTRDFDGPNVTWWGDLRLVPIKK